MQRITSLVVIIAVLLAPWQVLAQEPLPSGAETQAFRQLASAIPPGTRIRIQAKEGRRVTATLLAVEDTRIVVQRESRMPEPAVAIAFDQIVRLERHEPSGFSLGKAIGIGLAAGVGAILTMFAIAVSIDD